jgi:tRNA(Ile)-lysidine synthetase-like protein
VASDALDVLGTAISRRVVRHMLGVSGTEDEYGPPADHVQAALSLRDGAVLDLGPVRVSVGGGWLAVGPVRAPEPVESTLAVPGRTAWPLVGADLVAERDELTPQLPIDIDLAPPRASERLAMLPGADPDRLSLRLPPAHDELTVRTPRAGDRIRTDGGTRKLQDVLVDAGVPRVLRPMLPVVVSGERLAWVPGLAADRDLLRSGRRSVGTVLHLVGRRSRPRTSSSLVAKAKR